MTVKEAIELLSKLPGDYPVLVYEAEGEFYDSLADIELARSGNVLMHSQHAVNCGFNIETD